MSRFAVVNAGLLSTFQDQGRADMLRYALSASGVMDQMSYRLVNLLLGNRETDAAIEMTMVGLKLRALSDGMVAVGGADLGLVINGRPAPMWTVIAIKEGDVVGFKGLRYGMRAYLGVRGGFDAPLILGSRSVYLRGSLGRALKRGDEVSSLDNGILRRIEGRVLPHRFRPAMPKDTVLRILPGPQLDYFSQRGIRTFTSSIYTISPVSDRQGIRTDGPPVDRLKGPDIITDPTPMGGIQIPGNGVPIILHRDAQVTGGYAKIALLCQADHDLAGQLCPGDEVRFHFISRTEALALLDQQKKVLADAQKALVA